MTWPREECVLLGLLVSRYATYEWIRLWISTQIYGMNWSGSQLHYPTTIPHQITDNYDVLVKNLMELSTKDTNIPWQQKETTVKCFHLYFIYTLKILHWQWAYCTLSIGVCRQPVNSIFCLHNDTTQCNSWFMSWLTVHRKDSYRNLMSQFLLINHCDMQVIVKTFGNERAQENVLSCLSSGH